MPAQVTALVIVDVVKDKIVQYLTFEFSLLDRVSDQTCRGEQVIVDEQGALPRECLRTYVTR